MARVEVYEISNISSQLVTFGYSTIDPRLGIGVVDPRDEGILKLANGASTTIEAVRTERGELESLQNLGLIRFDARFVSRPDVPQPPSFSYSAFNQFVGFAIVLTPQNLVGSVAYWSVQNLPSGWTFDQNTGVVSGPAQGAPTSFSNIVVSAVSPDNLVTSVDFDVNVVAPGIIDVDVFLTPFNFPLPSQRSSFINAWIDWGDGSPLEFTTDVNVTHPYAASGTYNLRVIGELDVWDPAQSFVFSTLRAINELRMDTLVEYTDRQFSNQLASVPPLIDCPNLEILRNFASNAFPLTGTIPSGFFANCTNLREVFSAFSLCFLMSNPWDTNWFANNPNLESVEQSLVFAGVSGPIPTNLFDNNPNLVNVNSFAAGNFGVTGPLDFNAIFSNQSLERARLAFSECSTTAQPVPTNYFSVHPNLVAAGFGNCNLTGPIPGNLFDSNPLLEDVQQCFNNNSGLTGSIPSNLFDNNPNLRDVTSAFSNCPGLTGSIPAALFANNPLLENVISLFQDSTGLTGTIPALFTSHPLLDRADSCFQRCSGLTSIVGPIFTPNSALTNVGELISNTAVTAIPGDMIGSQPNITIILDFARACTSLTSVGAGLFDGCPAAILAPSLFDGCTNGALTSLPLGFWDNLINVFDYRNWPNFTNFNVATVDDFLISVDTNNIATGFRQFDYDNITGGAHLDVNRTAPALTAKNNLITKGWILLGTY